MFLLCAYHHLITIFHLASLLSFPLEYQLQEFPVGEENGNPLQYSCLGNTMDRGVWQGTVHGISKESDMIERLNN